MAEPWFAGATLDDLLIPGQRQLVMAFAGFAVYPLEGEGVTQRCPGIAVPTIKGLRHPTRLFIPGFAGISLESGQSLDLTFEAAGVSLDLDGLSIAVGESGGGGSQGRILSKPATTSGNFPNEPANDLDLNLVPDGASFATLKLKSDWKQSAALHARVDFGSGSVSATPDAHTTKCWNWGFTPADLDIVRRTTSFGLFISDALTAPEPEIKVHRIRGGAPVATIRTRPFDGSEATLVYVKNLPVDENGEPTEGSRHEVNLAHLQAVVDLCNPSDTELVSVSFGRAGVCPVPPAASRTALVPVVQSLILSVSPYYVGENWCSPRRMLVSM